MKVKKYLYLIQCNDSNFYKIGVSESPQKRLKQLQVGCPYPLNLVYKKFVKKALGIEETLHKEHQNKQTIGEWFLFSKNDIETIQQTIGENELFPKYISVINEIRAKDNLLPIKL